MRILVQRVIQAEVEIDSKVYSKIDQGYLLLVGFSITDDETILEPMVRKLLNLRIFEDENHKMNLSILQQNKQILSVSQFTLYADCIRGNRPSFTDSLSAEKAKILYDKFNELLKQSSLKIETGIFQADMKVKLINDGPVTIMLDSDIIIKKEKQKWNTN